jgi:hypothetical protein
MGSWIGYHLLRRVSLTSNLASLCSIVSARFEQHFVITGVGLTKGHELIGIRTVAINKTGSHPPQPGP